MRIWLPACHAGLCCGNLSQVAFLVATCLNLINLVFEDTEDKRQLALLTAVIKGLSWHCDHLINSGVAPIKLDAHGAL